MKSVNKLIKPAAIFIFVAVFFVACHPADNKEAKLNSEQVTDADTNHEGEIVSELSLNNGSKWKVDSSTNANVSQIYTVIADANPVMPEEYQKTAKVLQISINKMIRECRMQGAEHDALHHWLEPLMVMNKKMSGVTSADQGKESFEMIRKQIEAYSGYFE